MSSVPKLLIALAALAFLVAVIVSFMDPIMGIPAEAFSRASANLALLAIAIAVTDGGSVAG